MLLNTDQTMHRFRKCAANSIALVVLTIVGCTSPSAANIKLRKQIQSMESEIAQLKRVHEADRATIEGLRAGSNASAIPGQLDKLFTVHGLQIGRLTGVADLDRSKAGNEGFKVYVVPTDDSGQPIKAAGAFEVDAFDLSRAADNRLGHWEFSVEQARQLWYGDAFLYTYVLPCPWDALPVSDTVTLKIVFTDSLTGRRFPTQHVIKVPPQLTDAR